MNIIEGLLDRSRMILSLMGFILIAGTVAFISIPKEASPDINIPIMYTVVGLSGVSPEDAERLLIKPLEREMSSIQGVKEMRSTPYEGGGSVVLEFTAGFDAKKAKQDVKDAVDRAKPSLPTEANEPEVHEVNFSLFPILLVTLSGDVAERELLARARDLQDVLEQIPDVLEVSVTGDRDEVVEVVINPEQLQSYHLSPADVITRFRADNRLVAAGAMDTGAGRFSIKVPGLFEKAADIMNIPLAVNGEGVVRVKDVAEVRRTFKDTTTFARMNGKPALVLEVKKHTGSNIIDTIEEVKKVTAEESKHWPANLRVTYSQDQSTQIRTMLADLQNNVVTSVLLVMIIVLAFLGVRGGILVGVTIPGSFLAGILLLYASGFTVNIVVLFGLIMSVGMLVDGAIVVCEYADRKLAEGMNPSEAYALAAKRMAWPVFSSLATTTVVFLPLLFWPDVTGEFMRFLPITLVAVLSASLVMALIFLPVLGAKLVAVTQFCIILVMGWIFTLVRQIIGLPENLALPMFFVGMGLGLLIVWLSRHRLPTMLLSIPDDQHDEAKLDRILDSHDHQEATEFALQEVQKLKGFTRFYVDVLQIAISHPLKIVVMAFVILVSSWVIYGKFGRGVEFFPKIEPDQLRVDVRAQGNLSVQQRDQLVRDVEAVIMKIQEEEGAFKSIYTTSGIMPVRSEDVEDTIGRISLDLEDWQYRRSASEIEKTIRERSAKLNGIFIDVRIPDNGPRMGKPFVMNVTADDPDNLIPAILKIRALMDQVGGFNNVEDSRAVPGIEWKLDVDRTQAAKFGVNIAALGGFVQMVTNGYKIDSFRPNDSDKEVDIVLRLPESYRNLDELDRIRVTMNDGQSIPIGNFLSRVPEARTGVLHRTDGKRTMFIKAGLNPGVQLESQIAKVNAGMASLSLDKIKIAYKGEQDKQNTAKNFLLKAFAVALFLIAMILIVEFNNFYSVLLILTAVIMSTVGVMLGLVVLKQPFGIVMSGIGVISLAGLVVSNNIVLLDTFDRLMKVTRDTRSAIILTGAQRLRPVLLTKITVLVGLLPLTAQVNVDFVKREVSIGAPSTQWWQQLSTAIVCGILFATILTLIITPSMLMLRGNFSAWLAKRNGRDEAVDLPPHAKPIAGE